MEPFFIKFLIGAASALVMTLVIGIRYVANKLSQIVPEPEIRQLINDMRQPDITKAIMINERLVHIENKLDSLLEWLVNGRKFT